MPISIQCGGCAKKYKAPDKAAGKKVKCEKCGHIIAIPAKESAKQQPQPIALAEEEPAEIVEFVETESGTYGFEDGPPPRSRKPAGGKRKPRKAVREVEDWEDDDWEDDTGKLKRNLAIGAGVAALILLVGFVGMKVIDRAKSGGPSTVASGNTPSTPFTPPGNRPAAPGARAGGAPRQPAARPPVKPVLSLGRGLFRQVQEFSAVEQQFRYLSISADGKRVIALISGNSVYVWEQGSVQPKARYDSHQTRPDIAVLLPDGKRALSGGYKEIFIWDIATQKGLVRYEGHRTSMKAVAFTPDSKLVFSASGLRGIHVWEADTGKPLGKLEGHTFGAQALVVTADGSQLISSDGHDVRYWATNDFRELKVIPVRERLYNFSTIAAGGQRALFSDLSSVDIWDLENSKPVVKVQARPSSNSNGMGLSADGSRAVIATGKEILVWDVTNGKDLDRFDGDPIAVQQVAISADGKRIASAGYGKTIRLWELKGN